MPQAAEQNRLIALLLGCLVEHPERCPHMPHFVADDVAHDRGHFGNGEEFWSSRPVAFASKARRSAPDLSHALPRQMPTHFGSQTDGRADNNMRAARRASRPSAG